ncbi:hypothetical protein BH09MYX1_BH09MYX1_65660 [soil metagenome]
MALGGAYVGIAEGVDGNTVNVATTGVREAFSFRNIEVDVTGSVYFPGAFAGTDFENRGGVEARRTSGVENFLYANAGAMIAIGPVGGAFTLDYQSFTVRPADAGSASLDLKILRANLQVAYGFFHHQLSIGVGIQGVTSYLTEGGRALTPASGVSPTAGVLLRLDGQPWRFGATIRGPVVSGNGGSGTVDANGVRSASGYVLPDAIVVPAQLEAGVAIQLGPRPLNPRWIDPTIQEAPLLARIAKDQSERKADHERQVEDAQPKDRGALRERLDAEERAIEKIEDEYVDAEKERLIQERKARYENWPRPHVLVVASAVITAPISDGVAISSFLEQRRESYGRSFSVSPHYGLEGEPIPDWVRVRLGGYLEPSLFEDGRARQHFTFGSDFKLFAWDVFGLLPKGTTWQLAFGVDLAPRYSNWGVGIGVWH